MSKATYWQRGETLDYRNTTDTKMEATAFFLLEVALG